MTCSSNAFSIPTANPCLILTLILMMKGRQKVIDYVVEKYGKNQVAQIVTYGTMAARSSIKDVARVMDLPLFEANSLVKLVPEKVGTTLGRCLKAPLTIKEGEKSLEEKEQYGGEDIENIKKLREIYNGTDIKAQVLKEAERLEGSVRNTGIHAAGIIIAPKDLTDLLPVAMSKESDLWITPDRAAVPSKKPVFSRWISLVSKRYPSLKPRWN